MKGYITCPFTRKSLIRTLLRELELQKRGTYRLTDQSYIILHKVERNLSSQNRYPKNPITLLTFIENFENSVGDLHASLGEFGIRTRTRYDEQPPLLTGTKFYAIHSIIKLPAEGTEI